MERENNPSEKKTQGRKKIPMKKIENKSARQVTFSKRRSSLFKKAHELCILTGAEIAVIVHSSKHVYLCGHPSRESVVDRFLGGEQREERGDPASAASIRDNNRLYSDVCTKLEAEKRRKAAIEAAGGGGGEGSMWWGEEVDGLGLDELQQYNEALEELMKKVTAKADEQLLQNSITLQPPPAVPVPLQLPPAVPVPLQLPPAVPVTLQLPPAVQPPSIMN